MTIIVLACVVVSVGVYLHSRRTMRHNRQNFHQQMDSIARDERLAIINQWTRPEPPCQARPVQLLMSPASEETR